MSDVDNTRTAEQLEELHRQGLEYQRAVADVAEELGPMSPEFAQWCRDMDEWRAHILSVTNRSMRHIAAVQHHLHMSRSNNPPRQPGSHVYDAERGTIRRYD